MCVCDDYVCIAEIFQMSLSYLPGTASLLEELDKKLMVLLRDGR